MQHRGVLLFHAHRGTAAADVAGQPQQLFHRGQLHRLLPHGFCRLFQVQALRHGDAEHIDRPACAAGDQRLVDPLHVLPQRPRDVQAVFPVAERAFRLFIRMRRVGNLLLFQNAHDVGFLFLMLFALCHAAPPDPRSRLPILPVFFDQFYAVFFNVPRRILFFLNVGIQKNQLTAFIAKIDAKLIPVM